MNGTTGHTTAKITAQHDLIYDEFIHNFGRSKARLYYEANIEALRFIEKTVEEHKINCDFSKQDAYIYSTTEEYASKLEIENLSLEDSGFRCLWQMIATKLKLQKVVFKISARQILNF